MIVWVRPPPKFPQPPAVAFAVPITLGAKRIEFQNWFTTKVDPKADTKKRTMIRPVPLVTSALQPTTTAPHSSSRTSVFTGPNLLHDGAEDESRKHVKEDRGDVGVVDGRLARGLADAFRVH